MNELAYALQAGLPLAIWRQVDAPRYHKGFMASIFIAVALIVTSFVIVYLQKRDIARQTSSRLIILLLKNDDIVHTEYMNISKWRIDEFVNVTVSYLLQMHLCFNDLSYHSLDSTITPVRAAMASATTRINGHMCKWRYIDVRKPGHGARPSNSSPSNKNVVGRGAMSSVNSDAV